jgi:O-antigen ligase
MLDRWFGVKTHHYLHILGMMVLAFGLPMNKVLMSIGAIWGISNLFLEGKFKQYWENCKKNNLYLLLLTFFVLHAIGLFWSENIAYGLHDLKVKLPLFAIPIALVAHPIQKKAEINLILLTFLLSLIICSGINFNFYITSISLDAPERFREMSLFVSHIRFAILIVIGFVISAYFAWKMPKRKWSFALLSIWFLTYTFYSQVISGLLSLLAAFLFFALFLGWKYKWLKVGLFSLLVVSAVLGSLFIQNLRSGQKSIQSIELVQRTAQGHVYYHDTVNTVYEQGQPIYIHISEEELKVDWHKYSKLDYNGKDAKGHALKETLFRYMTAKNLKKDAIGLRQLSKSDITNIENGLASPLLLKKGVLSRINALRYQIENSSDPNGQSLLQRLEYWKTGIKIIQENLIIGVGTGDVQDEFNAQYEKEQTLLQPEYWFRAHNMFMTIQITFGIFGSALFISFLFFFLKKNYEARNILAFCLFGVIVVSFFIEDTLETQTGVSLFSLFFGLFLQPEKDLTSEKTMH